ncbi:MAG: hydroxymethylglutaryl-CoA lyase [Ectothiorhodospiraceae bacterium]|nr:hydroxymethylglutaryl-CoA lyase [Chromatiales bacterium]MCP5154851.1 hydroxymethylglutaryl-CoA lyase [Ectothiorhodospiraceae bacterium]
MLSLPERVTVVEVGPRDGLQSLDHRLDTARKVAMIERLADAGLPVIEVTSFAHPRAVPNLDDAEAVLARVRRRPGTVYRALVPNKRGALRAVATDVDELLGLMTVSEAYLARNQRMSLDEAIAAAGECLRVAEAAGRRFLMAVGMAMYCPYEGVIAPERALECVARLRNLGIRRFYLAASSGMETPIQVGTLFRMARDRFADCEFGFHVHERMGLAPASLMAALDAGATSVEGSICGIGGGIAFPGGTGAVGNLPTEDIVSFLDACGVETGLDPGAVLAAARDVAALAGVTMTSRAAVVGTRADFLRLGAKVDRQ